MRTMARKIIDTLPNRPFSVTVFSLSNVPDFLERHQRFVTALPLPSEIIQNQYDDPLTYTPNSALQESSTLVNYQALVTRLHLITNREEVKKKDEKSLTEYRQSDTVISNKYQAHKETFPQVQPEFENTSDRHHGCINIAKHSIELTSKDAHQVHNALYFIGNRACQLNATEIQEVFREKFIKPASI